MPNRPDRHWARALLWGTAILVALLPFRAVAAQIESLHGLDEFIDVYRVAWRDPYVRLWDGRFLIFVPDGKGAIGMLRVAIGNEIQFTKRHER